MMLARAGADIVEVLDRTPEDAAEICQLAESFALDELSACARLFSQNDVGARAITIPQLAVELAFIDCLHLHRQRSGAAPAGPNSPSASAARPPQRVTPSAPPAPRQSAATVIREAAPVSVYTPPNEVEPLDLDALPAQAAPPRLPPPQQEPPVQQIAGANAVVLQEFADDEAEEPSLAAGQTGVPLEMVISQWEMVKKACKTKTPKLAALLNNAVPVAVTGADGSEVVLQVEYDFHYKKLLEPESRSVIEWALKEILQLPCRCRFIMTGEPIPVSTPVASAAASQPHPANQPVAREPNAAPTRP